MLCPKCNKEILDNETFCNYCGKEIAKKESNKLFFVVIAIVIVLVMSVAVFFGYRRFNHRTLDFSSIEIVRYLNKSSLSLHMDDITNKGIVVEPSYGNTTVTTWIDDSGEEDSNKCISFSSDRNAKKYCEDSEPSSYRLQYGNIVLDLSSKIKDDTFADYKNEMADLEKNKDSEYTKKRMIQNQPSSFADFDPFMKKVEETATALTKYCTFEEQTIDYISNDGIYKNLYYFNGESYTERAGMYVEYNESNKITEIFVSGDLGENVNTYVAAVTTVFHALNINENDGKSIVSHLIDKEYEITIDNYSISTYCDEDGHYPHMVIEKASK